MLHPRRHSPLLLLLPALLACDPKGIKLGDDSEAHVEPPVPTITVSGGALDPLLGTECALDVTAANGSTVALTISDEAGTVLRTLADGSAMVDATAWDGRDETGMLQPVGTYLVDAELLDPDGIVLASATADFYIVRVGVLSGTLGGERIPLIWHLGSGPGHYWEEAATDSTFEIAALDDGITATALPALWDDLDVPPASHVGEGMPAAYPYDAVPSLTLAVAGDFGGAPVHLTVEGWGEAQPVAPGDTPTFTRGAALATGPSVVEESVTFTWSVGDTAVGAQTLPMRLYATLGEPGFEQTDAPYEPWVAAIDPALRAISGVEATDEAVTSALTEWIYRDAGISYDTRYGASYYTSYSGRTYNNALFDFTSFLARRNGTTVNCTDCASILEAYADMLGANLSYTIILQNFDLNFIKAIGGTDFTHCPFGASGCSFSYHAVTTPDDTLTIYDATLALDGDDAPGAGPFTELLVQHIEGAEYLERLVMDGTATYNYTQKEMLR